MKILSLILRIVSLVVILGLAVVWFLKKDELAAISTAYDRGQTELNMSEEPLSKVIIRGLNDRQQLTNDLREKTAEAAGLTNQLTTTQDSLRTTEDQLRATTQTLRNTRRDLEVAENKSKESQAAASRMETELTSARQDLIRVNQERLELNRNLETANTEIRSLQQRIVGLESDVEMMRGGTAVASTAQPGSGGTAESRVGELEGRLERALAEIERLRANPLASAISPAGTVGSDVQVNQVRVSSVDLRRGLVVLSPSPDDDMTGKTNLVLSREGSPIANLRVRNVLPNYVVAEILPSSIFASALEAGSIFSYR